MLSKINNRRFFHISLLVLIVLLQCLVLLFWYLESSSDDKITKINNDVEYLYKAQSHANQSQELLLKSQMLYKDFLQNNNKKALNSYYKTIAELSSSVANLESELNSNSQLKSDKKILDLKSKLDLIVQESSFLEKNKIDETTIKKFDYQQILNSISLDSIVTRDNVARKSFFSRIADAISGKYNIQKERIEIIISYEYQNKVKSGEVKSELERILKDADNYYKNQMTVLKESFGASNGTHPSLYALNDKLMDVASDLILEYNAMMKPLKKQSLDEIKNITNTKSKQRNYLIFFLTLLMLMLSIVVFRFTLFAFDLEKKWVASQGKILKNLEYKNKIMGMISHEVRSPLNIISLYSKLVTSKVTDPEMKEVFGSIQHTTSTLLLLTNQILEYSKNEDRKMILNKSNFYLQEELTKMVEPLQKLCVENGNQFHWKNAITTDCLIFSDPIKINQLFYNLVGNALKYTKNGTITVETKTEKLVNDAIQFQVTVIDTGFGISKEDIKNVFEDYFQGSNGINSMGIGLGLKLCKEIVELFDGDISIQSELNKGTNVSFTLKLDLIKE